MPEEYFITAQKTLHRGLGVLCKRKVLKVLKDPVLYEFAVNFYSKTVSGSLALRSSPQNGIKSLMRSFPGQVQ